MGEYKDGKWSPTFGDDQFGVIDTPRQQYETINRLRNELGAAEQKLKSIAELPSHPALFAPNGERAVWKSEVDAIIKDKK